MDIQMLEEGDRVGRFVILRDVDGRLHAILATSVSLVCEADSGCMVLLPGGRAIMVERDVGQVLTWLGCGL
jgi:hypothetical protein